MPKLAWRKVFDLAIREAKKIKRQYPKMKWTVAMKKAWRTRKILKAKAAYHRKYGTNGSYKKKMKK